VDIGAGDGRYALHVARTCPDTFAIALEPSLDALRDTARALTRRALPNIALVVAAAESATLDRVVDEATVHFPWGALLDAVLGQRPDVLAAVARPLKVGASLRVLVSTIERDGREPLSVGRLAALRTRYAAAGLEMRDVRPATTADIDSAHSSWGKRLGAGRSRPAFVVNCVRRSSAAASVLATPDGGADERPRASHR
jgi:hypothetical protein